MKNKADGFYLTGAAGEGHALRPSEKRVLTSEATKQVNERIPCIVQVASTDFSEMISYAKFAKKR